MANVGINMRMPNAFAVFLLAKVLNIQAVLPDGYQSRDV